MSHLKLAALALSIAAVGTTILILDFGPTARDETHSDVEQRSEPARSSDRASSRAIRAETNSVELSDLRHQVRQLTIEAEKDPTEAPISEPQDDSDLESMSNEEATDLTADTFDEHLAAQTFDPEATREAQSHMATIFDESEIGGRLLALDCGADLCRGQLAFDDVGQRDARLHDVGGLMPWDADGFFHSDPEDDTRVSLYFSREGKGLPNVGGES